MNKNTLVFILVIFFTALLAASRPESQAAAADWQRKVDPWVMRSAAGGPTEFLVFLAEQADLSRAAGMPTRQEKGAYVFETLQATARRTQGPVLKALRALGLEHRAYWVANLIWVHGELEAVQTMAERDDVARVAANPSVPLEAPFREQDSRGPAGIEWNISKVGAPDVWEAGFEGQGAVIAGADTGYDWDHPALQTKYRGWSGGSADHNYSWHDAIHSGGGSCGADTTEPCDDFGHGTHTMGTMVGDDGGANQIGMAPGARWIGCRNMNVGFGTPATYAECFQWFIAPTDLNGQNPDPSMAPDVINNSWSCPPSEGCTDPNVLLTVVQNTRAAGIVVVVSAGNSGSNCSTVNTPAAIYAESFTVGSTTMSDTISTFSSRGPVTADGSNRLKPDITAPGSSVRSSVPNGGYGISSGTSMAGPHVAGLVALLISANPGLSGDVDKLQNYIESSAVPLTNGQDCGGVPGSQVPNNTFGFGRIDSMSAYNRAVVVRLFFPGLTRQ
jgi:subtilisin family serine protease